MANRSTNSSIVDRLLAARASDAKSKTRHATSISQDKGLGPCPSATMSANDRRELVQRMLQQRKQATFTETPSSPQIQSHRPHDHASLTVFSQEPAASALSPAKPSAFRPGELISPASSPDGSTAGADPIRKQYQNPGLQAEGRDFQESSRSSHVALQGHSLEQHRYAAAALEAEASEGPPALHACMSPPIHLNGVNRYTAADESPASLGASHLRPHPPQHHAPSPHRPPSTHRRSRDAPSQHLPCATSPGTEAENHMFSRSYGPTAAEPLMMETSSMVLRGEPSDASLQHPDPRNAVSSGQLDRPSAFANGPVLAPELSWQSTGASDSALGTTNQNASSARRQVTQSRHESVGHESSTTQSLYFACDLLAEGSHMSHQHTVESSGSFHHDPLRRGPAPHALQDSQQHGTVQQAAQRQSVVSSGMGGMPPMAYSTTSAPSMQSDAINSAAAVDPFAVPPMPSAEPSGAPTDVSADLTAAGWPAIPTEACDVPGDASTRVPQSGGYTGAVGQSDQHSMHALQSVPLAAPTGPMQLDSMYESLVDSWQTQDIGALEKQDEAGFRRVAYSGAQRPVLPCGGDIDLTAPVGRSGAAGGLARGRGRSRQEILEEVMRERVCLSPSQQYSRHGEMLSCSVTFLLQCVSCWSLFLRESTVERDRRLYVLLCCLRPA